MLDRHPIWLRSLAKPKKFRLDRGPARKLYLWTVSRRDKDLLKEVVPYLKQNRLQATKYPGPFYRGLFVSRDGFHNLMVKGTIQMKARPYESWTSNPAAAQSIIHHHANADQYGVIIRRGKISAKGVLVDYPWLYFHTTLSNYDSEDLIKKEEEIVTKTYCTSCKWEDVEMLVIPNRPKMKKPFKELAEQKGLTVTFERQKYGSLNFAVKGDQISPLPPITHRKDIDKLIQTKPRRRNTPAAV